MADTWKEYKKVATETTNSSMKFFKLETAVANVPVTQFIISSLYRSIGINSTKANQVTPNADAFYKNLNDPSSPLPKYLTNRQLHNVLNGSLNIPKGGSLIKDQYLISPVISEIASFGGNMRRGSSWNSGGFILEIIANSAKDDDEFLSVVKQLYRCLSDSTTSSGGVWNDFLKSEFKEIAGALENKCSDLTIDTYQRDFIDLKVELLKYRADRNKSVYHESSFSKAVILDIISLCKIESENKVTRQQWVGLLESYFRLLIFNHSINTMNQSRAYFSILVDILKSNGSNKMSDKSYLDFINAAPLENSNTNRLLNINSRPADFVNDNIQMYCLYNHFLHFLFERYDINIDSSSLKDDIIRSTNILLSKFTNVEELLLIYSNYRKEKEELIKEISVGNDRQLAQISECLTYISQKKIFPKDLKSYIPDVNYLFARRNGVVGNPYMFELGSGTFSLLTGLIFKKRTGVNFLSGLEYIDALKDYNIELSINDISSGNIKEVMQSLGIVIDSPDTEGGVLIVKPGWV